MFNNNNYNQLVNNDNRKGNNDMTRKPTIYEVLKSKLEREPTHRELCNEVKRILAENTVELASKGKLKHQRRG